MAEAESLTYAFLRAHPAEAAQVLEALPAAETTALLARTPVRLAVPVLAAMAPAAAARLLDALDDERAMALLAALGAQPAVALLRHVGEPRRSRLIAGLPAGVALVARLLLGYPEGAVGAWADPEVLVLAPGVRAGEALERVRASGVRAEVIFVAAPGARLEGLVPLATLLRAPEPASLDALMHRADALLAAHTPLAGAAAHPGWRDASALPVVDAGDRPLGILTRDALARASERAAPEAPEGEAASLPGMLARGYWDALSAALEAAITLLPAARPVGGRRS